MRKLTLVLVAGLAFGCGDDDSGTGGTGGVAGGGGSAGGVPLLAEYVLDQLSGDDELVPESGTFDPTNRAFYVGSATLGRITRVDADGQESIFYEPPVDETWRTLGMIADSERRRLWVCAQEGAPVTSQEVWVFDLDSGERSSVFDLEEADPGSTCNDIAIDAGGLAYISDSSNPRIYRADVFEDLVFTWADDPLLAPDGAQFGGNGIAVSEDDMYVILSKTFASQVTPRLLRIERVDPTNISGITTTPDLVDIADGMTFLGGDLYIALVNPGDIVRLTSTDNWVTATIARTPAVAGTSTVRPAEGSLYAIYSDIANAILMMPLNPPFLIFQIDLNSFE